PRGSVPAVLPARPVAQRSHRRQRPRPRDRAAALPGAGLARADPGWSGRRRGRSRHALIGEWKQTVTKTELPEILRKQLFGILTLEESAQCCFFRGYLYPLETLI